MVVKTTGIKAKNAVEKAVVYMIDVWDEVLPENWRDHPDHVQAKFIEAEKEMKGEATDDNN